MDTFEQTFGNLVVTFNNSNEYIEMGPVFENPVFEGLLIREKFSNKFVEIFPKEIKFFLGEFTKITKPERGTDPLVKLIYNRGWDNLSSSFAIVISDYDGIRVKFFMEVSHQYNSTFDAIETKSPEFKLEDIIKILKLAVPLIERY